MKIAYAGFDLMHSALESLTKEHEIIKLFTCAVDGVSETNTAVIGVAGQYRFPYTCGRITCADIDSLLEEGCELLISAGYYYRIPVDKRLPMVNIHPSLLPYGRGAWPMPLAILDGLTESGVTVHKTEIDFDAGDILLQRRFPVEEDETLLSFMEKVNALLPDMMRELCGDLRRLWDNARPQGEGAYQQQPDPMDYVLTAEDTAEHADRVLRAFYGFPCYYRDAAGLHELRCCRARRGKDGVYPLKDGSIFR